MKGKNLVGLMLLCGLLAQPSYGQAEPAGGTDRNYLAYVTQGLDEIAPDEKAEYERMTQPIPDARPAGKPTPFIDDPVISMALVRMNRIPCSRVNKLTREARLVVLGWIDGYVSGRAALDPKLRECVDKKTGSVNLHGLALKSQDMNLKNYCVKNPKKTVMDFINEKQEVVSDDIFDEPTMPEIPEFPDFKDDK